MKDLMKKITAILLALLICVMTLTSCSGGGKKLMKLEGESLSVNMFQLFLSRMKGTLKYYGYEVDKSSFWKTVVSLKEGTTYDDYFRATILQQAVYYVVAEKLFDDAGLKLSADDEEKIDDLLAAYEKKAGSKTKLNESLKEYGINCDMLREIYTLEAKIELLKTHLYGKDGEKIDEIVKQNIDGFLP